MRILKIAMLCFALNTYAQKPLTNQNRENQKTIKFNTTSIDANEAITLFSKEFKLDKNNIYKSIYSNKDKVGIVHEKFQQYYKNIKIEFGTLITHSKDGYVTSINGELYDASSLNIAPKITPNIGLLKALQKIDANSYLWENEVQAKLMNYKKPEGDLVIFPNVNDGKTYLAFKYDIYATNPISRQEIYVDANTGNILFSNQIIKHANHLVSDKEFSDNKKKFEETILFTPGTAATRYSGTKTIETTFDGTNYILNDLSRGSGIFTYNCQTTTNYQNVDFIDNDNNWTATEHDNAAKDNGALDAHWGAETTYDFWLNVFGRNSFDNNGAAIRSYVHYGSSYNNASWNGAFMTYGDGNSYDILTSIDVCGHEIGHAVCAYTANLVYQNESGAMNEGFSDIWGACIEHYGRTGGLQSPIPNSVWLIGEDISASGLRSMSNPNSKNHPDTYLGTHWYTGTGDSGGVHTNSGVLNHWFYILTEGKSATNNAPSPDTFSVTGIGMQKAAEIAYLAERDYLTPNSTYQDARNATIAVANSLYCANSSEAIAVTNAWFAVNVGEEYFAAPDDIALESIEENTSISCTSSSINKNITLKNQGLNSITTATISYTIDGGSPVNLTWNGNLNPCEETNYTITVNGLTRGKHVLSVSTTIVNDGRPENNTKETKLLINDAGTIGAVNSFTNPSDALITYNQTNNTSLWERGIRTSGIMTSDGNTVYTTNLATVNYPDNIKSYIVSQCYNLSNASNPMISFAMKYDLEINWDIVYVEYSTNYGANWTVLGTKSANWYNSDRTPQTTGNDCNNCPGAQWTGTNTTSTIYSYPLNSLGNPSNVIFRIVFHSDEAVNQKGVNIDDFVVSGVLANESFNQDLIGIYPNPSTSIFTISLGNVEPVSIDVYDISGKIILSKKDILLNDNKITIDLAEAAKGIYFIAIKSNDGIISKRIVKE